MKVAFETTSGELIEIEGRREFTISNNGTVVQSHLTMYYVLNFLTNHLISLQTLVAHYKTECDKARANLVHETKEHDATLDNGIKWQKAYQSRSDCFFNGMLFRPKKSTDSNCITVEYNNEGKVFFKHYKDVTTIPPNEPPVWPYIVALILSAIALGNMLAN